MLRDIEFSAKIKPQTALRIYGIAAPKVNFHAYRKTLGQVSLQEAVQINPIFIPGASMNPITSPAIRARLAPALLQLNRCRYSHSLYEDPLQAHPRASLNLGIIKIRSRCDVNIKIGEKPVIHVEERRPSRRLSDLPSDGKSGWQLF